MSGSKFSSSGGKRKAPKTVKKAKRIADKLNKEDKKKESGTTLSKARKITLIIGITLGAIALMALGLFIAYKLVVVEPPRPTPPNLQIDRPASSKEPGLSTDNQNPDEAEDSDYKEGYHTILLIGHNQGLTDVIMVVGFDTVNKEINMVSIPRDTVSIVATRSDKKINAAYNQARWAKDGTREDGINLLMEEIKALIGFRPDHYIMVDYDGVVNLVNTLGGVEFNVPRNNKRSDGKMIHYDDDGNLDINLSPGLQVLNGKQALGLLRFRSGYDDADLGRIKTAQKFLAACAKKAIATISFSKIGEYAKIFDNYVFTNLSIGNLAWFGEQAWGIDLETELKGYTPQLYVGVYNGASVVFLYRDDMVELINRTVNPFKFEIEAEDLEIYNPRGTSSGGSDTYSTTGAAETSAVTASTSSGGSSRTSTTSSRTSAAPVTSAAPTTPATPTQTSGTNTASVSSGTPTQTSETGGDTSAPPPQEVSGEPADEDETPDEQTDQPPDETPDDEEFFDEEIIYTPEPEFVPAGVE